MRDGGCTSVILDARTGSHGSGGDVLRLERFGALYYDRRTCSFLIFDRARTAMMMAAMRGELLEMHARNATSFGLSDDLFVEQVATWRQSGLLDEGFHNHAALLENDRSHGALTGPLVTHVQLTRACNLACTHCYVDVSQKPDPRELSTSECLRLFAELDALGSPVVVLAGGEPLVRRDIWQLIEGVKQHHLDAWLCSNGTMIDEERARRLASSSLRGYSISLDGPDRESHDRMRGRGRFEHACRGIRNLAAAGARDIQVRVTVTRTNADRLHEFAELAGEIGAHTVVFKPFRASGAASSVDELFIDPATHLRAVERAQAKWPNAAPRAEFGDGMPTRPPAWTRVIPVFGCIGGTTSASVTFDARVVACSAVEDPGDWTLREHTFTECWRRAPTILDWRSLDGNDQCGTCDKLAKCGGGCRARATGIGATLDDPDPWAHCANDAAARRPAAARLPILTA